VSGAAAAAPRAVCLIVNPSAGGGRAARLLPGVERALRGHGLAYRVKRTASLPHARALARAALERGEVAAAMGGDGLLGAVAGELRSTDGVLGVLPGGRGNDFARKLGIGSDPAAACAVLAGGREARVDVAEVGGRPYLGIASAGFDSDVQEIANATRLPLGRLVYLYATLRALRAWRPARWDVVVDGEAHAFRGYSVAVANSGVYGGGMYLVPQAALDDGLLDVVLLGDKPRARFLVTLPRVFRGTHVDDPQLVLLRGREVAFAADRPFVAFADGDPAAPLPVTVRVAHRALRVLVP
jgi:YegS/Rv2252/BmrU family lipid kinase